MSKAERIGLWVALGVVAVWLLIFTVMVAGELKAINGVLTALSEGGTLSAQAPAQAGSDELELDEASRGSAPRVGIAGARVLSDTLAMTVTVRYSGPGDLLYEAPELVDETGRSHPITGESLEEARFAFLDLVTRGQATTQMVFSGVPQGRATLVFNPNQTAKDAYVSPRVEVPVPAVSE